VLRGETFAGKSWADGATMSLTGGNPSMDCSTSRCTRRVAVVLALQPTPQTASFAMRTRLYAAPTQHAANWVRPLPDNAFS